MSIDDAALRTLVRPGLQGDGTTLVDELGLLGAHVRADLAALHPDQLLGVELKGETDTLTRLPRQVEAYGRVFDAARLVTTEHHLERAARLLPEWWSVQVAEDVDGTVRLREVRQGAENPAPDALARAQLLWRDEAVDLLKQLGEGRGLSRANRHQVHTRLAGVLGAAELRTHVVTVLQGRESWLDGSGEHRAGTEAARQQRAERKRVEEERRSQQEERLRRWAERYGTDEDEEVL